ncbi:MAG: ElyC/SanA/YdcF family protein [Nitriliruptoraceae bacterium]
MPDHRHPRRRHLRALFVTVAIVVALVGGFAATTPQNDTVQAIDAVVVLGGGGGERLALGQELAQAHDAELVLSGEAIKQGERAGLVCDDDVHCLRPDPWTTAGESRGTEALAEVEGWDRVAVSTSDFHTSRSRTLFEQCLGDRVDVVGAATHDGLLAQAYRRARELLARVAGETFARAC